MPHTQNKRKIGFEQESRVIQYLENLNYRIIKRNWFNSNRGEIDIIAIDPERFNEEYLVFIEVKYRKDLENSLKALPLSKQKQIKKLSLYYCKEMQINPLTTNISFDFIAVSERSLEHLQNIF